MKPLKVVKYLVVHCVANRCNKPFSVESLINTGKQKWGQVSYHWYVRRNGDIIPLLSESVQGIHVKGYNVNVLFSANIFEVPVFAGIS